MVNRVVLVGRLTRDPELKTTNNETKVASFALAIDDTYKGPDGKPTTSFINIVVWNKQAENVAKFCRKGNLVGVDGKVRQRTYEKKDGSKASVFEVIADNVSFLEPKGAREVDNEEVITDDEPIENNPGPVEITDDELPF